jgi:HYD1 signature containing ADP-ribosyltransferase
VAGRAAIGNALTQGLGVATGLQSSFSWRDVAVSAVAAPIAQKAGSLVDGAFEGTRFAGGDIARFASGFAGGVSGSLVRGALGGKIDFTSVIADAFGNALGNSLVDKVSAPKAPASGSNAFDSYNAKHPNLASELFGELNLGPLDSNPNWSLGLPPSPDELTEVVITTQKRGTGGSVVIGKGDTLTGIAARELGKGASQAQIQARAAQYAEINGIDDPRKVQAGAKLLVPAQSLEVSAARSQNLQAVALEIDASKAARAETQRSAAQPGVAALSASVQGSASSAPVVSGITPWSPGGGLPNTVTTPTDLPRANRYQIYANRPVSNGVVADAPAFYTAYDPARKSIDYIIGPRDLEQFTKNSITYALDKDFRSSPRYMQEAARFQGSLLSGNVLEGFKHLGASYAAAGKDPGFLLEMGLGMSGAVLAARAGAIGDVAAGGRQVLYHYTDEAGLAGITESNTLNPSLWRVGTKDVRYGNGQYVSDIVPGTKTPAQLSREFLGRPFHGDRFTNYVQIDATGLGAIQGRPGVFVIPNEVPLDLTGRLLGSGKVPRK